MEKKTTIGQVLVVNLAPEAPQFWLNTIFYSASFTFFGARALQVYKQQWGTYHQSLNYRKKKIKICGSLKLQPINYGVAACPKCDFHTVRRIFHTIIDYLRL